MNLAFIWYRDSVSTRCNLSTSTLVSLIAHFRYYEYIAILLPTKNCLSTPIFNVQTLTWNSAIEIKKYVNTIFRPSILVFRFRYSSSPLKWLRLWAWSVLGLFSLYTFWLSVLFVQYRVYPWAGASCPPTRHITYHIVSYDSSLPSRKSLLESAGCGGTQNARQGGNRAAARYHSMTTHTGWGYIAT